MDLILVTLTGQDGSLFHLDRSSRKLLPSWPVKSEFSSVLTGQVGFFSVLTAQIGMFFCLDWSNRNYLPSWLVRLDPQSFFTDEVLDLSKLPALPGHDINAPCCTRNQHSNLTGHDGSKFRLDRSRHMFVSILTGQHRICCRLDRSTRKKLPSWPVKSEFSTVLTGQKCYGAKRNLYSDFQSIRKKNQKRCFRSFGAD